MLSCPFHIHATLKLAPVLSQKSKEMHVVHTFCACCPAAKTSTVTLIFYFKLLIRTIVPFNDKKWA